MQKETTITISLNKGGELNLDVSSIYYVHMEGNYAYIHVAGGKLYQTRMTLMELEKLLGDNFVKVKRGYLVSIMAVYNITDQLELCNGESLDYVVRRKKEIKAKFMEKQKELLESFNTEGVPATIEEYKEYYKRFDTMPFAFADIEMVFNENCRAIDWIFRYGNEELARLENLPLDILLQKSFAKLFPNMDSKWLRTYERVAMYGEVLRIVDYSPEIDKYLDIICFQTFHGHCGCILFDISEMRSFRKASDTERAMALLIERMMKGNR